MTNPRPEHQLMTSGETARMLGVSVNTIVRWSDQGRLTPAYTPGKHRRFDRTQVNAALRIIADQADLMTADEVGHKFRVHRQSVARWAKAGILPSTITSSGRQYPRAAVEELLRRCGITPEESPVNDRYRELPFDPDNWPLSEEEERLDEIQARGLRERQADQERAGHRFASSATTGDDD